MNCFERYSLLELLLNSLEADEARSEIYFEKFLKDWVHSYSRLFEHDEYYDPRETKTAFLKFCGNEFDRQLKNWPSKSSKR